MKLLVTKMESCDTVKIMFSRVVTVTCDYSCFYICSLFTRFEPGMLLFDMVHETQTGLPLLFRLG